MKQHSHVRIGSGQHCSVRGATRRGRCAFGAAAVVIGLAAPVAIPAGTAAAGGPAVIQVELPGAEPDGGNHDFEPVAALDGGGTAWAVGGVGVPPGHTAMSTVTTLGGVDVWRSEDRGRTFNRTGRAFAAAGGYGLTESDPAIAAAPVPNDRGAYNVYVAGLSKGGSDVVLGVSRDRGATFETLPLALAGATPSRDRPWLAADGPCVVFIAYVSMSTGFDELVQRIDTCRPLSEQAVSSAAHVAIGTELRDRTTQPLIAGIAVDHSTSRVFVPAVNCWSETPQDAAEVAAAYNTNQLQLIAGLPSGDWCAGHGLVMDLAYSDDGGMTWTRRSAARVPGERIPSWTGTVAVGKAGEVSLAWSTDRQVWVVTSRDGGDHWEPPIALTDSRSSGIRPQVAADAGGGVSVAWIGTDRSGDPTTFGGPTSSTAWRIYVAKSIDGRHFVTQSVGRPIHYGSICVGLCTDPSGNLKDNFGHVLFSNGSTTSIYTDNARGDAEQLFVAALTTEPGPA